jgi:hypothetical protein
VSDAVVSGVNCSHGSAGRQNQCVEERTAHRVVAATVHYQFLIHFGVSAVVVPAAVLQRSNVGL